jgi:hypothetical protein
VHTAPDGTDSLTDTAPTGAVHPFGLGGHPAPRSKMATAATTPSAGRTFHPLFAVEIHTNSSGFFALVVLRDRVVIMVVKFHRNSIKFDGNYRKSELKTTIFGTFSTFSSYFRWKST